MNKERRAKLQKIVDELELLIDEEQVAHDNLPESLMDSETGDKMQEAVDAMTDAKDDLEELVSA